MSFVNGRERKETIDFKKECEIKQKKIKKRKHDEVEKKKV